MSEVGIFILTGSPEDDVSHSGEYAGTGKSATAIKLIFSEVK